MHLLYKRLLTVSLSLFILAVSVSTATAAASSSNSNTNNNISLATGGLAKMDTSIPCPSVQSGDELGSVNQSGSNGNDTAEDNNKVWWDISSDGNANEFPSTIFGSTPDGECAETVRYLDAESYFALKAKYAGTTKDIISVNATASRMGYLDHRSVSCETKVLGSTVRHDYDSNSDGDSLSLSTERSDDQTFFSKTIPIWWFLDAYVAVGGEVGYTPNVRASNSRARADITPAAAVMVTGEVIIDLGMAQGGVGAELTLVEVSVPIDAEMEISDKDGADTKICHTMSANVTLEALSGTLYVWGQYWRVLKGEWSDKYTHDIYDWSGLKWNLNTLYENEDCEWI